MCILGDLLADQLKTTLQLPSTTGRDLFDDQKRLILPGSLQKEFQLLSAQIQYAVNGEINDNCPGFVILTGLILENYKEQHREPLSRLFYLLLSWHLGDLIYQNEKSRFADIHSGSQTERWISESADRFTIPDTTGFLYTRKEKQQIEDSDQNDIILANAANAYHSLFDKVPISVLRHLQAPIIRQKPEKNLSKTDILSNVYPVFQHSNSHLPFICRYSRQGIEQGYKDRELSLPERLTWGMDAFEECLNSGIQVGVKMKPGQMLFLNNRLIVCQSNGTSSAKMVKAWLHSRQ